MTRLSWAVVVVLVATVCDARAVFAQTGSARPYRGLFNGAGSDLEIGQTIDVSMSLSEAYDDNLLADVTGQVVPGTFQASGSYSGLSADVKYELRRRHLQVGATAGTNMRYYSQVGELATTYNRGGIGVSAQLARRTSLFVNQAVSYAPSYALLYGLFPGVAEPSVGRVDRPVGDYGVNTAKSYGYDTNATLTQGLSRRAMLSLNSTFRYTDFVGTTAGYSDFRSYDAGGRFNYSVGRDTALRFGYAHRQAQYAGTEGSVQHDLDIGIVYTRPWSRTRKTTVDVGMGSSLMRAPLLPNALPDAKQEYRGWSADASLTHQMGRTWRTRATFRRGLGFVDGLSGPSFTNALTVATDGFLGRRTDLLASAAYSAGQWVLATKAPEFTTYTGDVRLRFAVAKMWAAYIEYLYYFYNFHQGVQLPTGISGGLERNGVRAGLTLWVSGRRK